MGHTAAGNALHMAEVVHFAALGVMILVYTLRLFWFFRFKAGRDRQAPGERFGDTTLRPAVVSMMNVAMPWVMESTRTKMFLYIQFVVFHLGVTAAIGLSFIIPYAPSLLNSKALVLVLQVIIFAAFLVGVLRIFRRMGNKYMRALSSPDDYFSLLLLTAWFFFAFLAVPNSTAGGEWHLLTYFMLTAFFLIYVPFSKISHYLYYPFTRYYLGKTLGRRGVYPMQRPQVGQ